MKILVVLLCLIFSACSITQPHPDNEEVRIVFYNEVNVFLKDNDINCKYLGPVVSSEGHWYSFLFVSNANLTNGSINDLYNKANEIGANVVYINNNIDFSSSVTLLGQAYVCS